MAELSIQQAIQQFLDKSKLKSKMQSLQIHDVWGELMGTTIAHYTDEIQLIDHKLIITTSMAPLKQELVYQQEKIRNRINEYFNEHVVREVIIR